MENFVYCTPTKLIFGKNAIEKLPETLKPLGKKILLTYGGGSIKKIGLYDEVKRLLSDFEVYELSGIEPNPKYTTSVLGGVKLCKEHQIDAVLAVGGGSVLDCSKAICAGALYDGEPWDLITYKVKAKKTLPLVDVLTLAATGSEYDSGCVISRTETNDKVGYMDEHLFPVASILDPQYTFSVSKKQTAAGAADAINHIMEQYFCENHSELADGMCESAIKSLIKNAKTALNEPENYEARGEFMVDCSLACNGILSIGNSYSGWPCHGMEHALSAYYDITHGEGLAILTPRWMRHILNEKTMERFVSFGTHIFGIDESLSDEQIAEKTIAATYEMFESFGIPMHLREVGIDESRLAEMAHHIAVNEGLDHAWAPLSENDILDILKASL
jgi:alcohol dehydrogenase YqhD (iron-dependent ADH family)